MCDLMASCFAWLKRKREPERAITLVIIGLDDAGKTTTIASIKGDPPDGITPTVGFANKVLTISRRQVTVYDLGGGAKFRDVWKKYYAEIYGVVFVVDSCNKPRIEQCKNVLHGVVEHSRVAGKPVLVLANKQDKEEALTLEAVDSMLEMKQLAEKVHSQYSLMGCSALKGYGRKLDPKIKQGLKWLIDVIVKDMSNLAPRIDTDVAAQKEENEKEKQARMERIRKIREEREKREKEAGIEVEEESDDDVVAAGKINPFQPIHKHLENVEKKQQKKKIVKTSSPEKDDSNETELQGKNEEETTETAPVKKKKKKKKKAREENPSAEAEDVVSAEGSQEEGKKKRKKKKKAGDDTAVEELGTSNEIVDVEEQITPKKKKKKGKKAKKTRPSSDDLHEPTEDKLESQNGYHQNGDIEIIRSDAKCNKVERVVKCKHFDSAESDPKMNSRVTLLEGNEESGSFNGCTKKKTKKKKKKTNRTAPAPEEPLENPLPTLPPPAWKTPPGSLNRLPSLAPLRNELGSSLAPPLGPLKPIFRREDEPRVAFANGPNGDDNDVVT